MGGENHVEGKGILRAGGQLGIAEEHLVGVEQLREIAVEECDRHDVPGVRHDVGRGAPRIADRAGARGRLVGHGVDDVVEGDADAEGGVFLGIERIVGVLPGIAEVHVVAHGHHHAAAIVVDAAPVGDLAGLAFLVGEVGFEQEGAGDLKPFIEIVDGVKNRVAVGDVENGKIGRASCRERG